MKQIVAGFQMPAAWAIRTPAPQPKRVLLDKSLLERVMVGGVVGICTMDPSDADGSCQHGYHQCSVSGCVRYIAPQLNVIGTSKLARPLGNHIDADVFLRSGVWFVHRYLATGSKFSDTDYAVSHSPSGIRATAELSFSHAIELCKRLGAGYEHWGLRSEFGKQPDEPRQSYDSLGKIVSGFYDEKGIH